MDYGKVKTIPEPAQAGSTAKVNNDQIIKDLVDKTLKIYFGGRLDDLMTPLQEIKSSYERVLIYHFVAIPEQVYDSVMGDDPAYVEVKNSMKTVFFSDVLQDINTALVDTDGLNDELSGYYVVRGLYDLKTYKKAIRNVLQKDFSLEDALELIGLYAMHGKSVFTVAVNRQSGIDNFIEPYKACFGMLFEMIFSNPGMNSRQFFYNMNLFSEVHKTIAEVNKSELNSILTLAQFRGKGNKNLRMRNVKGTYSILSNTKSESNVEAQVFISRMFFLHFKSIKTADIEKGIYGLYLPKGGDEVLEINMPKLLTVGMSKREIYSFCGLRIYRASKHYDKDLKIKATRARQDATNEFAAVKKVTEGGPSSKADYNYSEKVWKAHLTKHQIDTEPYDIAILAKRQILFKEYETPEDLTGSNPAFVKHVLEQDWKINSFQEKINYLDRVYTNNSNYISKAISDFSLDGVLVARVISHVKARKWELVMAIIKAHILTSSDVQYFNVYESSTKAKALLFWPDEDIWEYDNRVIKSNDEDTLYAVIAFYPFYINGDAMKKLNMDKVYSITRSLGNEVSVEVMASFNDAKKEIIAAKIKNANERRAQKKSKK